MGIFPKAQFDEKHLTKAVNKYKKDLQVTRETKQSVFEQILDGEGDIMRIRAGIKQLELQKSALEKEEGKIEARLEMLTEIVEND